jgi:predicted kinase
VSALPGTTQLLLLTGAPASGKTRLAEALAQRYGGGVCSKDEIKELLFDALGTGSADYSRRLSNASFAVLFTLLSRLLRPGQLLMLEGNFRRGEHEAPLLRALEARPAALAQIWCRAQAGTRNARLMARAADPGRHPGHADAAADPGAVCSDGFLELPGPRWEFDSDQPWEPAFHMLCTGLDSWCPTSVDANA